MAAPTVYKSTDTDAPVLDGQAGSLINVLTACLVDGYGAKSAAGWSIALGPTNNKIVYQNDTLTGSGLFFRVQDDGYVYSGQSSADTSTACLVGMHSYSDINTPVQPFPRVINGGSDPHHATAYGVTIRKRYRGDQNPTYAAPWIVVADKRTCYLITTSSSTNSNALPASSSTVRRGITAFGDIRRFNASNATLPKAFVLGGAFTALSTVTINYETYVDYWNVGQLNRRADQKMNGVVALSSSLESGSFGVNARVKPWTFYGLGGSPLSNPTAGTYMRYPSPFSMDIALNPLVICEDLSDPARTYEYGATLYGDTSEVGWLPGFYGLMNTTATSCVYRIGDDWATHTNTLDGDKQYLLGSLDFSERMEYASEVNRHCIAFSLQDWWA